MQYNRYIEEYLQAAEALAVLCPYVEICNEIWHIQKVS